MRANSTGRIVWELVQTLLLAFLLALLIRSFVVESFVVQGTSMEPTLHDGQRLLVNKFIYRLREPKTGDIVVFLYPNDTRKDYIKRVIAGPGQSVAMRDGVVYVDGEALDEPYVVEPGSDNLGPRQVPPGFIFVLGDNRTNSQDSRYFGFVSIDLLEGQAELVWWPPSEFRLIP